jgi:hypothetical protein
MLFEVTAFEPPHLSTFDTMATAIAVLEHTGADGVVKTIRIPASILAEIYGNDFHLYHTFKVVSGA